MSFDQPQPKSVNSPTRTKPNAQYYPFRSSLPDLSASASTAVVLAKDYKMTPLWQPEQSTNNAKAAAVSHNNGRKLEIREPEARASALALPARDYKMAPTVPSKQSINGATATANADSNEKSTEGPVIQGIRAVDTVSQASQSTVVSDIPSLRRKLVVVGDGASGKTALLL